MTPPRFLLRSVGLLAMTAGLSACVAPPQPYDYSAWKASKPASLLVLPPVNDTPDVKATYSVLSQVTLPLSEAGYYVLPVSLVDETFKENGLSMPADMQAVDPKRLHQIFGADAGVYITVKRYGTVYQVIASETRVDVTARIVDLRNGALLWEGTATASSAEQQQSSQGGLVGLLVQALVTQILNSATDRSHPMAGLATQRLLAVRAPNGVLPGPRSPLYGKP